MSSGRRVLQSLDYYESQRKNKMRLSILSISIRLLCIPLIVATCNAKHSQTNSFKTWKPHSYVLESSSSSSSSSPTPTPIHKLPSRWQSPRGGSEIDDEIIDLSLPSRATTTAQQQHPYQSAEGELRNEVHHPESTRTEDIQEATTEGLSSYSSHSSSFSSTPYASVLSPRSDFLHHHPFHRKHLTRTEEKAILGRAVLTTPHRRMPAIRIAPGPRPLFLSE